MRRSPGKRPLAGARAAALASAIAIAGALGIGELLVRALLPAPLSVQVLPATDLDQRLERENQEQLEVALPGPPKRESVYVQTPTGRRLRANARAVLHDHVLSHRTIEIRTNAFGFRGPELGPKSGTRILFLGDSITFADYLPEEETFVRRVEELARANGRSWETVNAGISGISLENEYAILLETGLRIDPDVVVLDFYLNDFRASTGIVRPRLPRLLAWSRLAQHAALLAARLRQGKEASYEAEMAEIEEWKREFLATHPVGEGDWKTDLAAFHARALEMFHDWGGAFSPRAWEILEPLLESMAQVTRERGIRFAIVAFPCTQQVLTESVFDAPQRKLAAIAERLDVPLLDMLPIYREYMRATGRQTFYDLCHHTPAGAELAAQAIERFLAEHVVSEEPAANH